MHEKNARLVGWRPLPGLTTHRAPRETLEMNLDDDEEEVIGPTIWEAAAEEEIQENFWCVAREPSTRDLVTSERTMSAPRTPDLPTRIRRAHRPHPAPSTRAGSITAARTATRARVTPFTTTSRTCPCATACPSAGKVAGTQSGCGQRRSEGAAHGKGVSAGAACPLDSAFSVHIAQMFSRVPSASCVFFRTHTWSISLHFNVVFTRENICEWRIQCTRRPT